MPLNAGGVKDDVIFAGKFNATAQRTHMKDANAPFTITFIVMPQVIRLDR
jgi:hypothetical protein